jgi:hypothetical protein
MSKMPIDGELNKYSCDTVYLKSALQNKINFIEFENARSKDLTNMLDGFEQLLVDAINRFVQSK